MDRADKDYQIDLSLAAYEDSSAADWKGVAEAYEGVSALHLQRLRQLDEACSGADVRVSPYRD